MGLVTLPSFAADPVTVNSSNLNGKVDPLATEFNGNIENANISASAAIAASKLNLATMAQSIAMSSKQFLFAKGADVASGTSIALGTDGNYFDITGTTTIQTITAKQAGSVVWLQFDGALTLTDDTGNLELNGSNVTVAAEDVVCLVCDGTNWKMVSHYPHVAASPAAFSDLGNTGTAIATDASVAEVFECTATDNFTLSNPSNATDGMKRIWRIRQDGTGSRTITLGSNFRVPTDIGTVTLTTAAGDLDFLGAIYDATDTKWDVVAFTKGSAS